MEHQKEITKILAKQGYNPKHVSPFVYTDEGAHQLSMLTHYFNSNHSFLYREFEDPNFKPVQEEDYDILLEQFWQDEVNRIKYCLDNYVRP